MTTTNANTTDPTTPDTIVLIHGLWMTALSWEHWVARYTPFSTLKSAFPVLKNPANTHKAVMLTPEEFHYAFTNTLTAEESLPVYERYAVPGPGRVLFQGALANFTPHAATTVDFHNDDRAPLLIIAGGRITSRPTRSIGPPPNIRARRRRSRPTRSSPAARTTRWVRRAGRRSPTTPSTGRWPPPPRPRRPPRTRGAHSTIVRPR